MHRGWCEFQASEIRNHCVIMTFMSICLRNRSDSSQSVKYATWVERNSFWNSSTRQTRCLTCAGDKGDDWFIAVAAGAPCSFCTAS